MGARPHPTAVRGFQPKPRERSRVRRSAPQALTGTLDVIHPRNLTLRSGVVIGLMLTYVWRFHDLAPVLAPLRIAALFTVGSWAFLLLAPRWPALGKALSYPYVWLFLLWSVWIAIGIPFALSPERTQDFFVSGHLKTVTMCLFLLGSLSIFPRVHVLILAHVFGAAVLTFYYAKQGFPTLWTPVPMYDRNDVALHFVAAVPLALFLAKTQKAKIVRVGAWGLLVALAGSAIMTQSRGGFLALGGVTVFLMFRLRGVRWGTRLLPILALLVGLVAAPPQVKERLSTLLNVGEDYNVDDPLGRVEVWKRGIKYTQAFPIFGLGASNFSVAEQVLAPQARFGNEILTKRSVAHNSFLEVAAETGLVGLVLFLGMLFSALFRLARLRARYVGEEDPTGQTFRLLCDAVLASFIAFFLAGFFLSHGYYPLLISLIALVAGLEMTAPKPALPGRGNGSRPRGGLRGQRRAVPYRSSHQWAPEAPVSFTERP
ncbi:O-antigen ligase family protein [Gemmatimonadota bacterium]